MSCVYYLSFGCVCWNVDMQSNFVCFSISSLIFIQEIYSHARSLIFSIPTGWVGVLLMLMFLNESGITTHLPLSITHKSMPSHLWMSSMFACLVVSYLCSLASLWWCNLLAAAGSLSCEVACCHCCIVMPSGMFFIFCMALNIQWCILRRIHYILCDSIATSFLKIATSGLWSVIILTFLAKQ